MPLSTHVLFPKSGTHPVSPGPQFGYGAAWVDRARTYTRPVGWVYEISCPLAGSGWLPA